MPTVESNLTLLGTQTIANQTPGNKPLVVQGAASQTAELVDFYDVNGSRMSRIQNDGSIQSNGVSAHYFANLSVPSSLSAVASSGGSLTAGTYYWVICAYNAAGSTLQSSQATATVTASQKVTLTWTTIPGASGYYIYRTTTSGTYGSTSLVTTVTNGLTASYIDTGAATTTGTPATATTGSTLRLQAWQGQTQALTQWQDSTNANVASVSASGVFTGDGSGLTNLNGSNVTSGTVPIANGGTGQTSASGAINALVPSQTAQSGKFLSTNGTAVLWNSAGTVTSVNVSGGTTGLSFSGGPVTSSGTITAAGTLAVANGGTGQTTGVNLPHAWVYFTQSGGTVTVQQSFGVASVARAGTGIYNVNYSNTLASANACVSATADNLSGTGNLTVSVSARSTGATQVLCTLGSGTPTDPSGCHVIVFGT